MLLTPPYLLLVAGGPREDLGANFFSPTVLRGVKPSDDIFKTETFGPVVASTTFNSDEEALRIIEETSKTGLASYFCTTSADRIMRFSRDLRHGLVGVNEGIISTAVAPFGGMGESGIGREGNERGEKAGCEERKTRQGARNEAAS